MCETITTTVTRRTLPSCEIYTGEPGRWVEVFPQQLGVLQRFFYGEAVWVPDPTGVSDDMVETLKLGDMVRPFQEIRRCQEQGRVRFFVARLTQ